MEQKISDLTPKGSNLSDEDLLVISEFAVGPIYTSKSITGLEIINAAQTGLQPTLVSGTNIKTINSTSLLGSGDIVISSGLTVGTTAIASGTIGRVLFEGTGNVLQQDSTLFWDNTNKRLGVGATPASNVRLDVRAQGALSSDIAFRVRNSANTVNLVDSGGNGSFFLRANTGDMHFNFDPANNRVHLKRTGIYTIITDNAVTSLNIQCNNGNASLLGGSNRFDIINNGNFHFEQTSGVLATSGAGAIVLKNRTAPSTNVIDRHYYYSADIVAGNAAPHFRTENGSVIKLYQQTTATTAATVVNGSGSNILHDDTFDGYTLEKVVKALRNMGLLA